MGWCEPSVQDEDELSLNLTKNIKTAFWIQSAVFAANWTCPSALIRKVAPTGRLGFEQSTGLFSYRQASSVSVVPLPH